MSTAKIEKQKTMEWLAKIVKVIWQCYLTFARNLDFFCVINYNLCFYDKNVVKLGSKYFEISYKMVDAFS